MKADLLAHVLHGQLQPGLVAGDGFVLGPVVLKHPVQLLHAGAQIQVDHKDGDLHHALQQGLHRPGQRHKAAQRFHAEGGQRHKQHQGQHHAQHRGRPHQRLFKGVAQMVLQPLLQLGRLLFLFVPQAYIRRVHQVAVAQHQIFHHVQHTSQKGDLAPGVVLDLIHHQVNGAVRLAHGHADLFGAAHHDALDEGLTAHPGAETFLWFFHGYSL